MRIMKRDFVYIFMILTLSGSCYFYIDEIRSQQLNICYQEFSKFMELLEDSDYE